MTSACSSSTAMPRRGLGLVAVGASSSLTGRLGPAAATAIATICWASTSSALRGTTVGSIRPSCMRRATTAHSSRSPRNLGKIRPRLTSPTPCPARPIRCSPRATDLGDSICSTRSTAPMSMPSSSELVATRHGSSPAFSSSSTFVRSSRASEPWWARAISAARPARPGRGARGSAVRVPDAAASRPAVRQLVQPQRDALGRAAVVDEHDRRVVLAHEPQQLRVDRRPDRAARGLAAGHRLERIGALAPGRPGARPVRPSTRPAPRCAGRAALLTPASTIVDLAARADEEAADLLERVLGRATARSAGRAPAGRPRAPGASRRSSVSARCEPRLVAATAWISSTITASTPLSISRACEVSIR